MKIALTLLSGVGYGGVTYFQHLIPVLAAADTQNEYHLFVPSGHPLLRTVQQKNFIFHECMRSNQFALKRFLWEQFVLPLQLKKYRIDLLFTAKNMNVFFAPCKTVIAGRNMEPLAYREYDNDWQLDLLSWVKWQLTKWSVRKANHIIAVSQAVKDRLQKKFLGIERKVTVVYNGNPAFKQSTINNHQSAFILTASKFVAYANQLNLLKGYVFLRERMQNAPPLWFAGGVHDKKYFAKVQQFVHDAGLVDCVQFLGLVPHDRLLELMRSAKAFVFPSTLESCPHTLIEAMACGVPIAASDVQPMPEICVDAAVYFDASQPKDIAEKCMALLYDEHLQKQLSARGVRRAADFTWEKTARGLCDVFAKTMQL